MVMLGNLFIHRFNTEIVPDFASNEYATNIPYTLTMDIDAFGSTSIQISYDGSPVTPYVTPSFCDSLLAPVVTPTLKGFSNIVHDMDMILNQVDFTTGNMNNRVSVQVPGTANFQTLF
jgi:hypothetical protein